MDKQDKEAYINSIKDKTDREIEEIKLYYLKKNAYFIKRIQDNIIFFFWAAIVIIAMSLYFASMLYELKTNLSSN